MTFDGPGPLTSLDELIQCLPSSPLIFLPVLLGLVVLLSRDLLHHFMYAAFAIRCGDGPLVFIQSSLALFKLLESTHVLPSVLVPRIEIRLTAVLHQHAQGGSCSFFGAFVWPPTCMVLVSCAICQSGYVLLHPRLWYNCQSFFLYIEVEKAPFSL